jgi:3-oxoacyl-[acyl-carrier-protein] synthase-3
MRRRIKILGMGRYLPERRVSAAELDATLGLAPGSVEQKSGVLTRYFAGPTETASFMGARAGQQALDDAGLTIADVDAIVCASGSYEQAIPCTAVLIQRAMGHATSGIPCFDINSTCLSFLVALDTMSCAVAAGRYRRVLIVSSEIASVALDWNDHESATILGDGAAAAVIGPSDDGSALLASGMESYSSGAGLTQARGGGTRFHPRSIGGTLEEYVENYMLFEMDGKAVFKLSSQLLPGFIERTLASAGYGLDDASLIVPHQASVMALKLIQRRLGLPDERFVLVAQDYGNMVAASIPFALTEAIRQGRVRRGDRLLLVGTSAGFSMGAALLEY